MMHQLLQKMYKIALPLVLLALMICGCAPTTQVVLMPDPDGKVGTLEVSNAKGKQALTQAWQATESAAIGETLSEPRLLEEKKVRQAFNEALAAEPIPPVSFIIYFRMDSSALSKESLSFLNNVIETIRERKSTDIIVSGHTDAVGSIDYNHRLSLRRAKAVTDLLIARGIDRQNIEVTYHGKGNPLFPTPDGVSEPRNRRVEITVR
ncbi:MAG: OmpA family protein [Syntrophales bacterium]|nr:OmpA family protein [Syntrophales bacterium]